MQYTILGNDEHETIWNSRDGATIYSLPTWSGLGSLVHVKDLDQYAPEHVPALGDRIIVDVTEVRARQMAEDRVARWELRESEGRVPQGFPPLRALFRNRAECVRAFFEATFDPTAPDIAVVNAGLLEHLLAVREGIVPAQQRAVRAKPATSEQRNPLLDALSYIYLMKGVGKPAPVLKSADFAGLTLPDFVRAMEWLEGLDDECLMETVLGSNLCVTTWRLVDNSFGAVARVYYETQLVENDDPTRYKVLGLPRFFYATEAEARAGHTAMIERVQNTLTERRN